MQLKAKKETNILSAYWSYVDRRLILTVWKAGIFFLGTPSVVQSTESASSLLLVLPLCAQFL